MEDPLSTGPEEEVNVVHCPREYALGPSSKQTRSNYLKYYFHVEYRNKVTEGPNDGCYTQ